MPWTAGWTWEFGNLKSSIVTVQKTKKFLATVLMKQRLHNCIKAFVRDSFKVKLNLNEGQTFPEEIIISVSQNLKKNVVCGFLQWFKWDHCYLKQLSKCTELDPFRSVLTIFPKNWKLLIGNDLNDYNLKVKTNINYLHLIHWEKHFRKCQQVFVIICFKIYCFERRSSNSQITNLCVFWEFISLIPV